MEKNTKIVIGLNILAGIIQVLMPEGSTSIVSFGIFALFLIIIIHETYLSEGWINSLWLSFSKCLCYIIVVIVLAFKQTGSSIIFSNINILMIIACLLGLSLRYWLRNKSQDKRSAIILWSQNLAVTPGVIAYIYAMIAYPEDYGIYSFIMWIVCLVAYIITLRDMKKNKERANAYIFPIYATIVNIIYLVILTYILWPRIEGYDMIIMLDGFCPALFFL